MTLLIMSPGRAFILATGRNIVKSALCGKEGYAAEGLNVEVLMLVCMLIGGLDFL